MLRCGFPLILGMVIRMSSLIGSKVHGADWRKSRHSMNQGNCIEVTSIAATVIVRDTAQAGDLILTYAAHGWRAFVAEVKAGKFDRLVHTLAR